MTTDHADEPGLRVFAAFTAALVEAAGGDEVQDWQTRTLWNTMTPAERAEWNTKAGGVYPVTPVVLAEFYGEGGKNE